MTGPATYAHKPTTVEAMQFTSEDWNELEDWLLGEGVDFQITPTHLLISTTQGDSRDIGLGGWVIKRKTPDGYEFYPVEAEVMNDYELADDPKIELRLGGRAPGIYVDGVLDDPAGGE